jgi:integrase
MGNASVKLIMRPSKRRADGTAPVYLRAIFARQAKEAATGVWVEPKAWNAQKQEVRKSHPLAKPYNARLEDLLNKARASATRARSAADVIAGLDGRAGSLSAFLREHIDSLKADKAYWERKKYETLARKLHAALGHPWPGGSIPWDALTPAALDRFYRYLRDGKKNNANTVRKELIRLQTVCRKAVRAGALRSDLDPFTRYKLPKGQPVRRRRLSLAEVQVLAALDLEPGTRLRVVRDAFLVAIYAHGARVSDVLTLTREHVVSGDGHHVNTTGNGALADGPAAEVRLVYRMQKTAEPMTPKLPPAAVEILRPYLAAARLGGYLFPLMKRGDDADPVSLRKRQQTATTQANEALKTLGTLAGIGDAGLTTHVARHTFADLARQAGDLYAVSKALGHKDLATTQRYLASFDRAALDNLTDSLWSSAER